jgi:transposase
METYIGLDAHSATCTFISLDANGKILAQAEVPTTEGSLLRYVRSQKGERKLVFEESGLAKWLYTLLKKEVDELVVCHPGYLNKRQGAKNDRNDALHLANELRCGHVVPVFHEPSELMDLRVLVSGYTDVVNEIVRAKNRYKALFRSEALSTKGKTIFGNKAENRVEELSNTINQFVARNLFAQIGHLGEIKKKYQASFAVNMKKHPNLKRLDSVPGIDIVRAHVIAAWLSQTYNHDHPHNAIKSFTRGKSWRALTV